MTLSARSSRNFLEARDSRQEALAQALRKGRPATIFLSLNIPGTEKTPPGSEALFLWALDRLHVAFPTIETLADGSDALGPHAILAVPLDPLEAKRGCIAIESGHPAARLIDLDVYAPDGEQVDRRRLASPARSCLVCGQAAVECIRAKRHPFAEIIAKTHELLVLPRA